MSASATARWLSEAIGNATRSAKFCVAGCLPVYPGIEIAFFAPYSATAVGPASLFQIQPIPFKGNCDPFRASSGHTTG